MADSVGCDHPAKKSTKGNAVQCSLVSIRHIMNATGLQLILTADEINQEEAGTSGMTPRN